MIRGVDPSWRAEVVPDPDPILARPGDPVVSADSGILERCGLWVDLARHVVDSLGDRPFVVDLRSDPEDMDRTN